MNAPRRKESSHRDEAIRMAESDRRFARLLDATLGSDVSPRRRQPFDVTQRVLASLGFREVSAAERRARRVRRHGQRLMQAAVLAAAAVGGVMLHNLDSSTIHGDDALPRALDRTLDGILRTGFVPDSAPGAEEASSSDRPPRRDGVDGLFRRLDSGLRDRLRWPSEDRGPAGHHPIEPNPIGPNPIERIPLDEERLPTETATAPFRWI